MLHGNRARSHQNATARILAEGVTIYSGKWMDLPIAEEVMLQKSVEYFHDPEPCYIHRAGVRQRLLGEIADMLGSGEEGTRQQGMTLLRACLDCSEVTEAEITD